MHEAVVKSYSPGLKSTYAGLASKYYSYSHINNVIDNTLVLLRSSRTATVVHNFLYKALLLETIYIIISLPASFFTISRSFR